MKTRMIFGLLVAAVLTFTNCSEDSNEGNFDKTSRLTVRLTDAPFPFDLVAEANVTVFKIDARLQSMEDGGEDEVNGYPFITLMEEEIPVNLLDLTNGTTMGMADLEVPVGTYDLVRVYVRGVNVVLTDGTAYDLKVPSGEQTGIKVFIKPGLTVAGGLSSDLLLDFDVSRSFIAKGDINTPAGIKGFNFTPVIKASNISTAGTLTGNVGTMEGEMALGLEGAQISVFAADTLNTTGFSDVDGNYTIMGLSAGTYRVLAEKESYLSSDTLDIEIVAANKTTQDFVLEAEEASETDEGN